MAYEVTANRKRPQDFDHLVGQEFVVSTIKNALLAGRIAHAYLFAGPRGVGKTSAARILAKALNCPTGPENEACFEWEGADEIAKGRSIDVIEIDGASNTSVNDVRAIKDEILFPPQSSRYKIYIIDEVHMLSNSAFNALLKTIEEPPPYILFIFATTELHKVPATIRSRCQQFMFRLIPLELIKDRLSEAAAELGVKAEDEALYWIAKESTGSMRDAYTLFDQVVSFSGDHISLEKIREKLGLIGLDQMNELASRCYAGDTSGALQTFHSILSSGVSVEQCLVDLTEYYRGVLFIQAGIRRESLLGYAPERFLPNAIGGYTRAQVERIVGILLQTYRDIRYSIDTRYELELSLVRISRMTDFAEPQELFAKFKALEKEMRIQLTHMDSSVSDTVVNPTKNTVVPKLMEPVSPEQEKIEPNGRTIDTRLAQQTNEPEPQGQKAEEVVTHKPYPIDEEHRNTIIRIVGHDRVTVQSLFEHVVEWKIIGETLRLFFDTKYAAATLKKEQQAILSAAKELIQGISSVDFQVVDRATHQNQYDIDDPGAEKVREIFRGEFVQAGE